MQPFFSKQHPGECPGHSTAQLVFKSPLRVYAGAGVGSCPPPDGAVVLDLAKQYEKKWSAVGIPGLEAGIHPQITVEWPDMGVPRVTPGEWAFIVKALAKLNKPIFVACMMGHGRTGTALAILGSLLGSIPEGTDPVEAVRKAYCPEAVEKSIQCQYITKVTGRAVQAKGSHEGRAPWIPSGATSDTSSYYKNHPKSGKIAVSDYCNIRTGKNSLCWSNAGHVGPCTARDGSEYAEQEHPTKAIAAVTAACFGPGPKCPSTKPGERHEHDCAKATWPNGAHDGMHICRCGLGFSQESGKAAEIL